MYATDISLGYYNSCAIMNNGSVMCWGDNNYGQLGDNSTSDSNIPTYAHLPQGSKAIAISSGKYNVCTILDNNSIYCWGQNSQGQLGIGQYSSSEIIPTYTEMPPGSIPVQISLSERHTCSVLSNGSAYCWGYN